MATNVEPIPEGYHSVTPYLIVDGADKAIVFYTSVFGAAERMRLSGPDGRIGHAELKIGDSVVMLADENLETISRSPRTFGGSPVGLALYLSDVDAAVERAVASGAKIVRPVADQFYGDRSGTIEDPFGHVWYVMTHIEDVSEDEMRRRMSAMAQA